MSSDRLDVWARIAAGRAPDEVEITTVAHEASARLGRGGALEAGARLGSALLGAGPLQSLVDEPGVTDIAVNGDGVVWADRGDGLEREQASLGSPAEVRALAVRLAGVAGRRLDESAPYVDGQLPGGVRLHAVLPPVAPDGAHITLRVPRRSLLRVRDFGGEHADLLERLLGAVIERRVSFVVTGGTGAGKTSLLGAMLAGSQPSDRVLVVEDVRELAVAHPHVVRLEARSANLEGAGAVSLAALVRQALRMRPDRLVVGEVRGAEVRELLTALNTGHAGGCGTVHANAVADVVARFEALGSLGGMSPEAVASQLASAVRVVVHCRRDTGGRRLVAEIGILTRGDGGRVHVEPAWTARSGAGPGWDELLDECGIDPGARVDLPSGPHPRAIDRRGDDRGADDRGADNGGADNGGADDRGADNAGTDDRGADESGTDDGAVSPW